MNTFDTIAAYIAAQPADRQAVLEEIYATVKRAAPKAEEAIKYGMPTFVGRGNLVHFAAMKGHLGFYPTPSAIREFATELAAYSTSKGCVRFPYSTRLPKTLIANMVRFRVREDQPV